ncbi:putative F-box domain, leucine-rich repeat domain superfamily, F-box-like domain superfamily [Helianthus annuus]|nr:putative F-box domain, leucine-rich repeat domain superfamily, F-box-like domain superfamily [Helianthus annuus]
MALKASKTEDVISSMPEDVVTHILDRLPVQDAVKTSILSRNWRFKWTMLSQLVFDDNFFDYLTKTNGETYVT